MSSPSFQPGAVLNTQAFGNRPENVEVPHYDARDPANTDVNYPIGKEWINTKSLNNFILDAITASNGNLSATWVQYIKNGSGPILTITGDTGGAEIPDATGNFNIKGTANQVAVTGTTNTETLSLIGPYTPATYTAHGVLIGEGTSSIVATTPGATGQALMGSTGADPSFTGSPSFSGSVTAATTITATLGDITATNGNFVSSTAGKGLSFNVVTASGASPQTANARAFSVTFTGVSIASGATQDFDIANTQIVGASTVAIVDWHGATAGSALSKVSQVSTAGHLTITMTNGTSATMVTSTADITFTGIVLN